MMMMMTMTMIKMMIDVLNKFVSPLPTQSIEPALYKIERVSKLIPRVQKFSLAL